MTSGVQRMGRGAWTSRLGTARGQAGRRTETRLSTHPPMHIVWFISRSIFVLAEAGRARAGRG